MKNSDQLSITATAFDQWREKRVYPRERTPLALRQQAVLLYKNYSSSKITTALKISGTQLNQWKTLLAPKNSHPDFIHLPSPSPSTPAIEPLNISLSFDNGASMVLRGAISSTLLITIIQECKL
jgi:hypothetical protein